MRCKKHLPDHTSAVGVCSSCLRERLTALIEAQTQAHARIQTQLSRLHSRPAAPSDEPKRKSDSNPPPLIFPRSVSPYVSRRKSDDSTWHHNHHRPDHQNQHQHQHQHQHRIRFYSTPQVGPTYNTGSTTMEEGSYKKSKNKFSLFSRLFRSRSEKFWTDHRASSLPATSSSTSSTPSWFSAIFAGRQSQSKQHYADETSVGRRPRGLSPDLSPDLYDNCDRSRSGSGVSAATTPEWKRTPALAPSSTRRTRSGQGKNNVSGLAFCLSPLVRASPNRHWNQKGLPPEIAGEIRVAASFCKNRSRKLADFGRANPNR